MIKLRIGLMALVLVGALAVIAQDLRKFGR